MTRFLIIIVALSLKFSTCGATLNDSIYFKSRTFFNIAFEIVDKNSNKNSAFLKDNTYQIRISSYLSSSLENHPKEANLILMKIIADSQSGILNDSLSVKDKELLVDKIIGYHFFYNSVAKNWHKIKNSNKSKMQMAIVLDNTINTYLELLKKSSMNRHDIPLSERKLAFLKGTYLAMPVGYRQHYNSDVEIGMDLDLLMIELKNTETFLMNDLNS